MRLSKNALTLVLSFFMIFASIVPVFAETEMTIEDRVKAEVVDAKEILKVETLVKAVKEQLANAVDEAEVALEQEPVNEEELANKETALKGAVEIANAQLALTAKVAEATVLLEDKNLVDSHKTDLESAIAKAKEVEQGTEIEAAKYNDAVVVLSEKMVEAKKAIADKAEAEKAAEEIKKQIEELKKSIEEEAKKSADANKAEVKNLEQLLLRQREQLRRLQKENSGLKDLDDEVSKLKKTLDELTNPTKNSNSAMKAARDNNFTLFSIGNPYYQVVVEGEATTKQMDVAPMVENGRTLLPLRYVAEALNFNVRWDGYLGIAEFTNIANPTFPAKTVTYEVKTGVIKVDGIPTTVETGFKLKDDRIFAGLRDITMLFGGTTGDKTDGEDNTVEWSQPDKAVFVYTLGGPLAKEVLTADIDTIEVKDIKQGKPVRTSALFDEFNAMTLEAKVVKGKDVDAKFYLVKDGKVVKSVRGEELVATVKGTEGTISFEIPKKEIRNKDRFDIVAVVGEDKKTFEGLTFKTEIPTLNGYVTTAGHGYFLDVKAFMEMGEKDYYDAMILYGDKRYRAGFDKDGNLVHEEIRLLDNEKYLYVRVADEFNNVKEFKFSVPVAGVEDTRIDIEKPEIGRDYLYIKTFGKNVAVDIEVYEKSTGYDIATMRNVRLNDEGWTMVTLFDYFSDNLKLDKDMIIKVKVAGADNYSYIYEVK